MLIGENMHKRITIILLLCLILCGCSNIKDYSIEDITKKLETPIKGSNIYHTGYKYYLPFGMQLTDYMLFNDVIEDEKYHYYLYASEIDYYNKTKNKYEVCSKCYYSKLLDSNKKIGYIEINLDKNGQYLIEIMYNYAKIEVMVSKEDINHAIINAVTILRGIKYNDAVINNLMGNDIINNQEENYNIFNTTSSDSNYLKYIEEDQYEDQDNTTTNTTLIE